MRAAGMMVMAEGGLDFAEGFSALHAGLALPEHHKTLATNSATGFNGGF